MTTIKKHPAAAMAVAGALLILATIIHRCGFWDLVLGLGCTLIIFSAACWLNE